MTTSAKLGVPALLISLLIYGSESIFYYQLQDVPDIQVLCHPHIWGFLLFLPYFASNQTADWPTFQATVLTRRNLCFYCGSALVLGGSMLTFLAGVMHGRIVEISLGYFLSPIMGVVLAVVVFKEAPRRWQYVSVAVAISGIVVIAKECHDFPFLGFGHGALYAVYAMIKKFEVLPFREGLLLELAFLFVPCLVVVVVLECQGTSVFLHTADAATNWLLVASGVVTVVPLLLYAYAAPLLSFTLFSFLEYIDPSLTFLIGVFVYDEEFTSSKLAGFVCIWVSLVIFTLDEVTSARREAKNTLDDDDDAQVAPKTDTATEDATSDGDSIETLRHREVQPANETPKAAVFNAVVDNVDGVVL
ncbi:Aste57867_11580 [Aphanomyces stellatus]|uniref:Aste57867_11580 protein n=1 Tax=Aphanomyces stellatus TaxID=120398 RepID=A0A485KTD8_9STRA|nr:hypothetical protein As57867_011537 [Aphanomyces stellatus]VFT88439.1 Aste57867_11580 [Aphanomyces stellatus]